MLICLLITIASSGQEGYETFRTKKQAVTDTITIDTLSIQQDRFKVFTTDSKVIDTTNYQVDFSKAKLFLRPEIISRLDSVLIEYHRYPDFLTKQYFQFDPKVIVRNSNQGVQPFRLSEELDTPIFKPFDGLSTSGSISRGVTVGNNQNSVLDSELDLQITGKISEKISLRASIQDANIPLQENGFSQNLDEFDQIFIELFGENWNLRAGDVTLSNSASHFARFTKKAQGVAMQVALPGDSSTVQLQAAGALVAGIFNERKFVAQEGNQGPYKLTGSNNELFVLIISGSERVYVNGILLKRGENEDYTIDYNAGEVRFNPTYPITSDMRITVQFQASERNYSRIIAYGGGGFENKKFSVGAYVYSENDAKNQPILQNLGNEQKRVLSEAGDDRAQAIAPSAVPDTFGENKIVYTKTLRDGNEVFLYAPDAVTEEVFSVRFTQVGANQGDYILENENAINRIFTYVAPVNGVKQGNFDPIIQLEAPEKLQTAVLLGRYTPGKNTLIDFEFAGSNNDLNLFSDLDDSNNTGLAGRIHLKQHLFQTANDWSLKANGFVDYIQKDYRSPERIYAIEFERNWNLEQPMGNQLYATSGFSFQNPTVGMLAYEFQHLAYSESYNGNRHQLYSDWFLNNFRAQFNTSFLQSTNSRFDTKFIRLNAGLQYSFPNNWIGTKLWLEDNQQFTKGTKTLGVESQRFSSHEIYAGIGDSTKVFFGIGLSVSNQ